MSTSKRARACDACHSIKIRCELGSGGGSPPCERCVRLGKECVVTAPKKQKDRVAELEAQVEALTKLLASQNIQAPDNQAAKSSSSPEGVTTPPAVPPNGTSTKRRRLDESVSDSQDDETSDAQLTGKTFSISDLDAIMSRELQAELLRKYLDSMMFRLEPVVPGRSYDELRQKNPVLLTAILYAAGPGMLSDGKQERLAMLAIDSLSSLVINGQQNSIELLQALQIVCLWWRTPKRHPSITPFQMMTAVPRLGRELGLAESKEEIFPGFQRHLGFQAIDGWRCWIVCYVIGATFSFQLRRKDVMLEWGSHEEAACFMLEYNGGDSDRLLVQCVRGERMCEQITDKSGLYNSSTIMDISDPSTQQLLQSFVNKITDWKIQRPSTLNCPLLDLWEHAAMIIAHESVLHTPTNKSSFSAPYIAERLSAADFAAPIVATQHVSYIERLRHSCHALINIFTNLETDVLINLPAAMFATKPIHAQFMLIKLYIALTAPGNTYGLFVDAASLQIHSYLHKVEDLARRLEARDKMCITARICKSATRIKDWLSTYEKVYATAPETSEQQTVAPLSEDPFVSNWPSNGGGEPDWSFTGFGDDAFDLDGLFNGPVDLQYVLPGQVFTDIQHGTG